MKEFFYLLKKDIALIFRNKAAILFLVVSSILYGNSFLTAIELYGKASKTALKDPVYAKSFEPVFGVFLPSFGGLYLVFTLVLPFCIIPLFVIEKRQNTLSLLYQKGFRANQILFSKFFSSIFLIVLSLLIPVISAIFWLSFGGHICFREFFLLLSGYLLYSLIVVSISAFAGSIFENISSASILALLLILYSWIIDFLKSVSYSPLIDRLSLFFLFSLLKNFENGVFSLKALTVFVLLIVFFLFLAFAFLQIGVKNRLKYSLFSVLFLIFALLVSSNFSYKKDISESYRNSFPPNISNELKKLGKLKIKIFLRKTDSRFADYKNEFLDKLLLVKPDTEVVFVKGKELEEIYGIFVYCLKTENKINCEKTYSNSPEEAFLILSRLSGIKIPLNGRSDFKGYPLIVSKKAVYFLRLFFYLFLPLLFVFMLIFVQKRKFFK